MQQAFRQQFVDEIGQQVVARFVPQLVAQLKQCKTGTNDEYISD